MKPEGELVRLPPAAALAAAGRGAAGAAAAGGAARPRLFAHLPGLRQRLPWIALAEGVPSPVEPLAALGRYWGLPQLYVKRDDRTSLLYGGNKVRKLEWLLAQARARGHRSVLTFGAWGSHHALATAIFAGRLGLGCYLVLCPQPLTAHVATNLQAALGAGARLVAVPHLAWMPLGAVWARWRAWRDGQGLPFAIPPGGSSPVGALGYVECGLEIAAQVAAGEAPAPDYLYVAAGTCGTLAGLAYGLALGAAQAPALARTQVVGVRVVPRPVTSVAAVRRLLRRLGALLRDAGAGQLPAPCPVEVFGGALGRGYGQPTPQGREAAELARQLHGLVLDPTYTAKCMAGLRAFATAPERRQAVHLYVHTLSGASLLPWLERGAALARFLPSPVRALAAEATGRRRGAGATGR
ncbi:MAG: hypothetical protein KatS3mg102_2413 [Planctomycetota bacterium]|nr:MAG: hypothetical protein KatS3mg102_2413 [Planctomycetota bacterium]